MPTFYDPVADASEAAEAMRGLAHASRNFEHPQDMYMLRSDHAPSTITATTKQGQEMLSQQLTNFTKPQSSSTKQKST